jgi:hypothetical protein
LAVHICGGEVTSVRLLPFTSKGNTCGCDEAGFPDDCCRTAVRTVQLNDEQIASHTEQPLPLQADVNLWADIPVPVLLTSGAVFHIDELHSPPGSTPSYILQHAFLI